MKHFFLILEKRFLIKLINVEAYLLIEFPVIFEEFLTVM